MTMGRLDKNGSNFYSLFIEKYKPDTLESDKRVKEILPYIIKFLNKGKILDIGCGCGIFSFNLEKKGFSVDGVDFNKKYLSLAKKYARKISSKVTFINKNLMKYTPKEHYQNIILLGNSLPHFTLNEFDLVLKNIKNSLKKGGRFIFEYNDWIGLLLTHYPSLFIEKENPKIISKHIGYSYKEGALFREFISQKKKFKLKLIIWSPSCLDYLMKNNNFKNITHRNIRGNKFISVYEKQ